jgi:hypothetical protein
MSTKQREALRLLSRKRGATVEELQERLDLASVPAARGMITRLKAKGNPVKSLGEHRFLAAA